jgi:hypothetical protein
MYPGSIFGELFSQQTEVNIRQHADPPERLHVVLPESRAPAATRVTRRAVIRTVSGDRCVVNDGFINTKVQSIRLRFPVLIHAR